MNSCYNETNIFFLLQQWLIWTYYYVQSFDEDFSDCRTSVVLCLSAPLLLFPYQWQRGPKIQLCHLLFTTCFVGSFAFFLFMTILRWNHTNGWYCTVYSSVKFLQWYMLANTVRISQTHLLYVLFLLSVNTLKFRRKGFPYVFYFVLFLSCKYFPSLFGKVIQNIIFCKILTELFLYESHFACMLLHEHLLKGQCQENFWTLFFTNQLLSDTIYLTATRCLCNPAFIFKVDCMHKELVDTWKSEVTNLVTLSV